MDTEVKGNCLSQSATKESNKLVILLHS